MKTRSSVKGQLFVLIQSPVTIHGNEVHREKMISYHPVLFNVFQSLFFSAEGALSLILQQSWGVLANGFCLIKYCRKQDGVVVGAKVMLTLPLPHRFSHMLIDNITVRDLIISTSFNTCCARVEARLRIIH